MIEVSICNAAKLKKFSTEVKFKNTIVSYNNHAN